MGGDRELFRRGGAELYLVDGDESVLMQRGEFVLLLVKHAGSSLAAVVAMVGDMQWPVGKDSLVCKLGETGFSFSNLPARLRYVVSLDNLEKADLHRMEGHLEEYSTYMHSGGNTVIEAAEFWTRVARSPNAGCILNVLHNTASSDIRGVSCLQRCPEKISPELAERMQQARRMSAVAKLFARSVERGAINASTHVKMGEVDASRGGSVAYNTEMAVASVDAVAKVVEAVETAGKTLLESAQALGTNWVQRNSWQEEGRRAAEGLDAVGGLITSAWTLNKVGLRMLFRTIASINSKSDVNQSSSSRSSDASCRLQLFSRSAASISSASSKSSSSTRSSPATDNASSDLQLGAVRSPRAQSYLLNNTPRANDAVISAPAIPSRLSGVMRGAVSLSAGSLAGPVSAPSFEPYKALQAISMESTLTPCPPQPRPSRSPH